MFSKKIDPMCGYCIHGKPMNHRNYIICRKKGVVTGDFCCRHYKYDALKRVPPGHPSFSKDFTEEDFKIQ